eukprot:5082740-Pleurochrysis_carterae.AAC.1
MELHPPDRLLVREAAVLVIQHCSSVADRLCVKQNFSALDFSVSRINVCLCSHSLSSHGHHRSGRAATISASILARFLLWVVQEYASDRMH